MARRLNPTPVPIVAPPPSRDLVPTRTKGIQIVNALAPSDLMSVTRIESPEAYLEMDAMLASIKGGRAKWALAIAPISEPLLRSIQKQKEALAAAKEAAKGVEALNGDISARFDAMERHVKGLMSAYKMEEARILREREEADRAESRRLQQEANRLALKASSAKSPQLKAKLEQERADLEQQAETLEDQAEQLPLSVKGASSTERREKKVKVDLIAFFHAIQDYEPVQGVYRMMVPPLRTTDKKGEPCLLAEVVSARLTDLWREQPGVVESWPGVTIEEEVTIANR